MPYIFLHTVVDALLILLPTNDHDGCVLESWMSVDALQRELVQRGEAKYTRTVAPCTYPCPVPVKAAAHHAGVSNKRVRISIPPHGIANDTVDSLDTAAHDFLTLAERHGWSLRHICPLGTTTGALMFVLGSSLATPAPHVEAKHVPLLNPFALFDAASQERS